MASLERKQASGASCYDALRRTCHLCDISSLAAVVIKLNAQQRLVFSYKL